MSKKFIPQNIDQEQKLVLNDDEFFTQTKNYLKPLILSSIDLFDLSENAANELFWKTMNDIPIAAKRFLGRNKTKKDYKFSTYFSWYIKERINKIKPLKRKKRLSKR
jgi:hypothetical protein